MSGTITAGAICDFVAGVILNDRAKVRFIQADLLAALNEACRFIAAVNPSASSDIVAFTCVDGARQTVPASAHSFLGPRYNLGSDGTTPGRVIDVVKRETIDVPNPYWRSGTKKTEVRHIVADDEIPTAFDVYPPVVAGTKIAIKLAIIPALVSYTDPIPIEDTYELAIKNFILSRMFQKNAEYGDNVDRATAYYQSVLQFLGMKAQVDPASSAEANTRSISPK